MIHENTFGSFFVRCIHLKATETARKNLNPDDYSYIQKTSNTQLFFFRTKNGFYFKKY